jgi:hypothetical protein
MSEKKVMTTLLGNKREVTEGCRKLHYYGIHTLNSSPNTISVIISKRVGEIDRDNKYMQNFSAKS